MDVFKAWPGRAESIVISQESYMRCTGGVAPWRRDGDKGPSYYAVCPLCDNPIQIVGLFRRQEESRARGGVAATNCTFSGRFVVAPGLRADRCRLLS